MKEEGRANKAAVKGEIKRAGKMRDKEWIFMSLITSFYKHLYRNFSIDPSTDQSVFHIWLCRDTINTCSVIMSQS